MGKNLEELFTPIRQIADQHHVAEVRKLQLGRRVYPRSYSKGYYLIKRV